MEHLINPESGALDASPSWSGPGPRQFHRRIVGFEETPLVDASAIAQRLGVGRVYVKDESRRIGLPSFKILGASWATARAIGGAWLSEELTLTASLDTIARALADSPGRRLVAATDGNHGRGVAWMARQLGLPCEIFVPAGTAGPRIDAIASEGASVRVVSGTYDDAIAEAARLASSDSLVISDTAWEGYEEVPRHVIDGYSTMFEEIDEELDRRGAPAPDVVVFQAGVGAFAAAGLAHYRAPGRRTVRTAVVEPISANCLMASARAGAPTEVPGPHRSVMAGLNCGLPSTVAWPVVRRATDVFLAIDDSVVAEATRLLAAVGVVAGESGAASLGGLLSCLDTPAAEHLGLRADSTVLLVSTEGATDPVAYRAIVGSTSGRPGSEARPSAAK